MLICAKKTNLKTQNLIIHCVSHLIQLVQYNIIYVPRIKVHLSQGDGSSHASDINFQLNYSAHIKCQGNFRFKVRSDNTFAL